MRVYWDTSAIIWFYAQGRIAEIRGFTRPHSLAEAFSALTGGGFEILEPDGGRFHKRLSPSLAEKVIRLISPQLDYVDLSANDIISALKVAQNRGVQGGRIHDLLHALAAEKGGAGELWTLDRNDFNGLGRVPLKNPSENIPS